MELRSLAYKQRLNEGRTKKKKEVAFRLPALPLCLEWGCSRHPCYVSSRYARMSVKFRAAEGAVLSLTKTDFLKLRVKEVLGYRREELSYSRETIAKLFHLRNERWIVDPATLNSIP